MSLGGRKVPVGCSVDKQKELSYLGLDSEKKLVDNMGEVNGTPPNSGLFHTFPEVPNLSFKSAPNETVIQSSDSYIVLGSDRPGSFASGFGSIGSCAANSIDLVVGRGSSLNAGTGPKDGTILDNLFASDAARINISQMTNIDLNFGLEPQSGYSDNSTPRSGIGIKADDIRIIGRNSVRIFTGKSTGWTGLGSGGEKMAMGGKTKQPAPSIELICGNHIILGESVYNAINGVDPLRPWIAAHSVPDGITKQDFVLNSLWHTKINMEMWVLNHLRPYGYRYVCSSNVKLT